MGLAGIATEDLSTIVAFPVAVSEPAIPQGALQTIQRIQRGAKDPQGRWVWMWVTGQKIITPVSLGQITIAQWQSIQAILALKRFLYLRDTDVTADALRVRIVETSARISVNNDLVDVVFRLEEL